MTKSVFLDRDGVINVDKGYVYKWEDFELLPGVLDALCRFSAAGYELIIVSNQSGIARGLYTESQYEKLMSKVEDYFSQNGVRLTATYYCPHLREGNVEEYAIQCECRKPAPGMLFKAMNDFNLDMTRSILVGDKISDIKAAWAAGVGRPFLLGEGAKDRSLSSFEGEMAESLSHCADLLRIPK